MAKLYLVHEGRREVWARTRLCDIASPQLVCAVSRPSASPQECLGIGLGTPGSSPAPEATLERGAPSKGSYTTGLEEVH